MNLSKYLLVFILLVSCEGQKSRTINYGNSKNESRNLDVPIKLSNFKNYGFLIDRIREITCNDSIPKIVVKQNNIIKNFYINEQCEPIIFDPEGKHYVTFRNGKPYEFQSNNEIHSDFFNKKFSLYFLYSKDSKVFLIIIESKRKNNLKGIEKFLTELSQEYNNLNTDLELIIAFWELVSNLSPLPYIKQIIIIN